MTLNQENVVGTTVANLYRYKYVNHCFDHGYREYITYKGLIGERDIHLLEDLTGGVVRNYKKKHYKEENRTLYTAVNMFNKTAICLIWKRNRVSTIHKSYCIIHLNLPFHMISVAVLIIPCRMYLHVPHDETWGCITHHPCMLYIMIRSYRESRHFLQMFEITQ